jgi:hypothetical protein
VESIIEGKDLDVPGIDCQHISLSLKDGKVKVVSKNSKWKTTFGIDVLNRVCKRILQRQTMSPKEFPVTFHGKKVLVFFGDLERIIRFCNGLLAPRKNDCEVSYCTTCPEVGTCDKKFKA